MPIEAPAPARAFTVALMGFSAFERSTLTSCLRLASNRVPHYEPVNMLTDADFLIADVADRPSVELVQATERQAETLFIGARAPQGSVAWMPRPIEPLQMLRELDAMVARGTDPALATALFSPVPPVSGDEQARAAPRVERRRTPPVRPAPPPIQAPASALLVDDSPIARHFLEARLKPWGLQVDAVHSSAAALEKLAGRSFDLVFLDVELGPTSELDGLALCRLIKRSATAVNSVVTMVSAHHSELDRVRGALAGCDAYLAKPLDAAELTRLLVRQGLRSPPAAA